jgi:hypothetical protein
MVVRVFVPSWDQLKRISDKPLEIAAGRSGEWYDLVVNTAGLDKVIASGLPYELTVPSLEYEKEKYRGTYLSYTQINDSLRHLAAHYPTLCKFDSLSIKTYEGRWLYGVKISDNVLVDENEPKFSIDGCHHSREWATPQACLFFADSMLRAYASVPEIQEIINTTEIYCFPLINVDGYCYDYPGQLSWRKNREPFGGAVGNDPNRNYDGSCNGEVEGSWGAVDEAQGSHYPSDETFCGAYAFSGDEVRAWANYIRLHNITTGFSLHSYGEEVMWAWGYKAQGTPDSALYTAKGVYMAGLMIRMGGGTYTPGQAYGNPYPTCGNIRDWVYGYNHYLNGLSSLFFGSEIGTAFYQPQADLDSISHQVFKAAKYLAGYSDSLILAAEGCVAPPSIYLRDSVNVNFTIGWHALNTYDNHPTRWELVELANPSVKTDSLESGTGRWILQGFTLATTQAHSGTHSLFSGNTSDMNSAVQTLHPYLVKAGDSVSFWSYYNLENNYDVAVVEVSENTKEWFDLDTNRFTGVQTSWVRRAFSLAGWTGKSVYIRFRCMYDASTNNGGFYVDDIRPVCLFGSVTTVSSNITDTLYQFTGHSQGEYYYYVRGNNAAWGWGDYSCLKKTIVTNIGVAEKPSPGPDAIAPFLSLSPNPFRDRIEIQYSIGSPGGDPERSFRTSGHSAESIELQIYDVSGSLIRSFTLGSMPYALCWNGTNQNGCSIPGGVYFVRLKVDDFERIEKAILLK